KCPQRGLGACSAIYRLQAMNPCWRKTLISRSQLDIAMCGMSSLKITTKKVITRNDNGGPVASPIFRLLLILALCVPVPLHGQGTPVNRTGDKSKFIVSIYTPSPQDEKIRKIAGALFQEGYLVSEPMERKVGEAVINYY